MFRHDLFFLIVQIIECLSGTKGTGGICDCSRAKGWAEGKWKTPWCSKGNCFTGQEYDECIGKHDFSLDDGTWCWNGRRDTKCLTSTGIYKY